MSEPSANGGNFPNRDHYFKAAMIGGGLAALLSVVPLVNWLNLFFFCLVIAGGTVSAYWVQKKTGTVTALEGAVIGALAGVVCGLLMFAVGVCASTGFSMLILPDMSRRESREFTVLMMGMLTGSCCMAFTLYPLFAGLGGLVAPLIWPPTATVEGAPKGEPTEEDIARRKKMIRVTLGSLGGCLGLLGLLCVVTGYLAYLQSRGPEDTAGQEAEVSANLVPGERLVLEIPPSDQDSTQYGIWLVADDDLPAMYELEARVGCREHYGYSADREPYMSRVYRTIPDDGEPAWLLLETEYVFGNTGSSCIVEVESMPAGVTNPRVVVTRLHEPSDWF